MIIYDDPIEWFRLEQQRAIESKEPFAATRCALATATPEGLPSLRFVLLKAFDEDGFVFYTNYGSHKAQELDSNPHAALAFHWATTGVQVRVKGCVSRVSEETSDAYFQTRVRGSQIGAWASAQSRPLDSRDALVERVKQFEAKFPSEVPRPAHWGGYQVAADDVEIWFDRQDRLHDRFVFRREAGAYARHQLNP